MFVVLRRNTIKNGIQYFSSEQVQVHATTREGGSSLEAHNITKQVNIRQWSWIHVTYQNHKFGPANLFLI